MDHKQEADEVAKKVYELFKSTDWTVTKTSNGVRVLYKKSTELEGHIYRAEGVLDASPEKVIRYIYPPNGLRSKWDKAVKESEVIERINEDLVVLRSVTHSAAMGLISPRDFLDIIAIRRYPDEGIVCTNSKSIVCDKCPPKDGYVRGSNAHCGTFCIAVDGKPDKCQFVNIIHTNIGGKLPKSVVEAAIPSNLIQVFNSLEAALKVNEDSL